MVSGTFGSLILLLLTGIIGSYDWRYVFLINLLALPVLLLVMATVPKSDGPVAGKQSTSGGFTDIPTG